MGKVKEYYIDEERKLDLFEYWKESNWDNMDYKMLNKTNSIEQNTNTKPNSCAKCECGSEVVYGKQTAIHSDWCKKYKKL